MSSRPVLRPLTADQCRAARALLGWSERDLSKKAIVALSKVRNFEAGIRSVYPQTLMDIKEAFLRAGLEFTKAPPGVRFRDDNIL
jgi:hypothetical protein